MPHFDAARPLALSAAVVPWCVIGPDGRNPEVSGTAISSPARRGARRGQLGVGDGAGHLAQRQFQLAQVAVVFASTNFASIAAHAGQIAPRSPGGSSPRARARCLRAPGRCNGRSLTVDAAGLRLSRMLSD